MTDPREYAERNARIVERRAAGECYRTIAADFGVSVPRVRWIAERSKMRSDQAMRISMANDLRDLAEAIQSHLQTSSVSAIAQPIVRNCIDHLNSMARVYELSDPP